MAYISIDYGKKRIGVAYSDESNSIAMPHDVVANDKNVTKEIEKILLEKKPDKIIIGRSVDFKGKPNKIQKDIEIFKKELKKLSKNVEIIDQDEFLTSAHVEMKNDMLDASAAALILQRYLETEKYNTSK